jgi:hypothetical protein
MSSAVETQTKTAPNPKDISGISGINGSGTTPDGGGDAPPDTDPGPIKH